MSTKKIDKFSFEELANRELLKQYNTLLKENKSLQAQIDNRKRVVNKNLKDLLSMIDDMQSHMDELQTACTAANSIKNVIDKDLTTFSLNELDGLLNNIGENDYLSKIDMNFIRKFSKLLEKAQRHQNDY